jgi:ABC-type branched-subunit amino acid transport system ATPase component/ABC-type branched-subunit amino acid transport system permease subunit
VSATATPSRSSAVAGLSAEARRRAGAVALLGLAVLLAVMPYFGTDYDVVVGYQVLQLAALAQAWNLMAGYGGLVSLATAAFIGIGSYATTDILLHTGVPLVGAFAAAGVFAAAFAVLVSVPMFRFRGLYFTIGTLVLAELLGQFMLNYNGLGGNAGLSLLGAGPSDADLYWYTLALAVLATLVLVVARRLRLGSALLSIRDDEDVAREVGVPTFRTKLWAFAVSAFVMGVVGGVQAVKLGHIDPSGAFTLQWTIDVVNATIIGGAGTVFGPLLGALLIVEFGVQLSGYPELHVAITGLILILVIRFTPRGIWGTAVTWAARRWGGPEDGGGADAGGTPEPARYTGRAHPAGDGSGELVEVAGLSKSFGGVHAVSEVGFAVHSGEVLGIIGPNGAGKSTLIGLLSGAHTPDAGTITVAGVHAEGLAPERRAALGIGRTHQVPRPFGTMTVAENLEVACLYGGGVTGRREARRAADAILAICGLAPFAGVAAQDLGLLRLKRLELARALALRPRVLLMDEIAAGLVETEVQELIALIKQLRREVESIVIVEHVLDVVHECCDRVVVLDGGHKLIEGEVATVMADEQVAAVYLGTGTPGEGRERSTERSRQAAALLEARAVTAGYGHLRALTDVSLRIGEGEIVALLGSNGAGKTTTARVLSGMIVPQAGEITVGGRPMHGRPANEFVAAGVAHCMEGRRIFGTLTVEENLLLGGRTAPSARERTRRLQEVYELFDVLRDKRRQHGNELSGGQQQQLAIGRALMAAPRLLLLDEISLGLAPVIVERMYEALAEINARGVAMLIVEQSVERGLHLADHVYVLEKGRVALGGTPAEIRGDPRLRALYVGEAKGGAPAADSLTAPTSTGTRP